MRLTIVLVALMAISAAATSVKPLTEEEHFLMFNGWIKEHGKSYPTIHEFEKRYTNFKATVELVRKHQANPARKWEMAVNKFADLTSKEFFEQYLMPNIKTRLPTNRKVANFSGLRAPDSVDWVAAGKVSGVKDQGQCGSCWSFSTTGAIESAYAIENSASPPSLSEQELVDCSSSSGNQGCNGGYPDDAFSWVTSNGGLCTEDAYPYTGTDGTCSSSSCSSAYTISSYTDVTQDSEDDLANAVANQPVSVLVDASQGWQTYAGGILDSSSGCSTNLDHAVLAVGYGSDNGEEYWTIKNSWGTSWGESGYIRLQKGVGGAGTCGVASQCSFPTGASQVSGKTRRHKGFYHV